MLAQYFQIPESDVAAKIVLDPRSAIAMDVASLRAITALPASWMISGINYDVKTGRAEIVVPPAPLRAA
jgi:carbonic anhydrase